VAFYYKKCVYVFFYRARSDSSRGRLDNGRKGGMYEEEELTEHV